MLATPLFSDEDADLRDVKWHNHPRNQHAMCGGGKNKQYAHRIVMERVLGRKMVKGEITDHINWNKLDNRRVNLRVCNKAQNTMNRKRRPDNTTGYTGVYLHWPKEHQQRGWAKRWKAIVYHQNKPIHCSYHKTPEEAALVYNEIAKEHYGEFAVLNDV